MITLLDYGAGNVRSVLNAVESLGERVKIVEGIEDILSAEKLIFPGVGNFISMIRVLRDKNYFGPIKEFLNSGRPFLGICLGLQVLFEESEEAPGARGLGIFRGKVRRFDIDLSVPHIGWNGINIKKPSRLFSGLSGLEKLYFVHSYHVVPEDGNVILTTTDYGIEFASSVQQGNIIAVQFHPEKSGKTGIQLLKNFIETDLPKVIPPNISSKTHLAKRIIACLDVRTNDQGDLVVTKGDRYDVRENGNVRNLGKPVELAGKYYQDGADEIAGWC